MAAMAAFHNWLLLCVTGHHLLPSSEATYRDPESAQSSCLMQCGAQGKTVASKYTLSTFLIPIIVPSKVDSTTSSTGVSIISKI